MERPLPLSLSKMKSDTESGLKIEGGKADGFHG